MKTIITKFFAIALSVLLLSSSYVFAENFGTVSNNAITAVYDYSSFGAIGSYSRVVNNAAGTETRVFTNMQIQGYQNSTGQFIAQNVNSLSAAGVVIKSHDIVNGTFKEYSNTGAITKAYTSIDFNKDGVIATDGSETYAANVTWNSNGSYDIAWSGRMSTNESGTTFLSGVTTSVEHYGSNGRQTSTDNYELNDAKTGVQVGSKSVYNYDLSGNIQNVTTYSSIGATTGKILSVMNYEINRGDSVTTYKYNDAGVLLGTYQSAKYNYDGNRLVSVTSYSLKTDAATVSSANTEVSATTFFDSHSRASYTQDAQGREVSRTYYNDTLTAQTQTVNGITVNVVPGGVLKQVATSYYSDGQTKVDVTLFCNGSTNFPAVTFTQSDRVPSLTIPNVWTTVGDPTVTGAISAGSIGADGTSSETLTVTTQAGYDAMIAGINEALYGTGTETSPSYGSAQYWANQNVSYADNAVNAARLKTLKAAITKQWTDTGKVSLCVGAISVSKIAAQTDSTYGAAMHTGASTNTGHATSVAYTSVQDTTLATQINNMSGQVQLTWDYWSIDNAGNVWIFANTATQK